MFFIECKYVAALSPGTIISYTAGDSRCVARCIEDGDIQLNERVIPVIHGDGEAGLVELDSFILKCTERYSVLKVVSSRLVQFDNELEYALKNGPEMVYDTHRPKLACCFRVPDAEAMDETIGEELHETLTLRVDDRALRLTTKTQSLTFKIPLIHCFESFEEGVTVNLQYFMQNINDHEGRFCKLYLETDYPVCMEFMNDSGSERKYLAPIVTS